MTWVQFSILVHWGVGTTVVRCVWRVPSLGRLGVPCGAGGLNFTCRLGAFLTFISSVVRLL